MKDALQKKANFCISQKMKKRLKNLKNSSKNHVKEFILVKLQAWCKTKT